MDRKQKYEAWKQQHETLWQFFMFMLMGCVTTIVDLGSFALFNFWIYVPFRDRSFSWWLIDYTVEKGGMTAFLSFASSSALSETVSFFVQRKTTFNANNNVAKSAVMYAVLIILVYFLQLYMPTLTRVPLVKLFGEATGDMLAKMFNSTMSMLIQFPVCKWVIMRRVET